MTNFKVGDFVIWDRGKYIEVHQVVEECLIKDHQALSNGANVHNDVLELWQPKVGEWCWFWYHNTDVPNFMMFSHITEDNLYVGNVCKGGVDIEFDCCEPFIRELPSFIKGKIND